MLMKRVNEEPISGKIGHGDDCVMNASEPILISLTFIDRRGNHGNGECPPMGRSVSAKAENVIHDADMICGKLISRTFSEPIIFPKNVEEMDRLWEQFNDASTELTCPSTLKDHHPSRDDIPKVATPERKCEFDEESSHGEGLQYCCLKALRNSRARMALVKPKFFVKISKALKRFGFIKPWKTSGIIRRFRSQKRSRS
eukprot:Gb_10976 [translate_table: standard]